MKNILVTGGLGFIGSHVYVELFNSNNNIIIIDNLSNSSISTIIDIEKIVRQKIQFYRLSLHEKNKLESIFIKHHIDSVLHFASLKSISESEKEPGRYYWNNVIGTKILIDVCKKFSIKNFIFSSSASVYGKPLYLPLGERHPINPINSYAKNKKDIEDMLFNDAFFKKNCSTVVLRYFNPIGSHISAIIGENYKGIPNNLMPTIIKVAKNELKYVPIFGNNFLTHDGTGVRDYIHIIDLANAHIKALNLGKIGISIFNLGTGKGYSVLDVINTFASVNKKKIAFKFFPRRIGDVDSVFADATLAKKIINFETKHNLEEMCHDSWAYARKQK